MHKLKTKLTTTMMMMMVVMMETRGFTSTETIKAS